MRYGIWQTNLTKQPDLEPEAKNRCFRAAWAAGYKPISEPVTDWEYASDGWRLLVWVEVEPRAEKKTDIRGFA